MRSGNLRKVVETTAPSAWEVIDDRMAVSTTQMDGTTVELMLILEDEASLETAKARFVGEVENARLDGEATSWDEVGWHTRLFIDEVMVNDTVWDESVLPPEASLESIVSEFQPKEFIKHITARLYRKELWTFRDALGD